MGQCYGKVKLKRGRKGRQFKHKRFDFTPKRSWRYRDAHLKSEFHDMALRNDAAIFEEEDRGDASLVIANRLVSDSEEELDTGEVRQGGRLVFSEEESEEEEPSGSSHLHVSSTRPRASSSGSEQVGRFEVMDVRSPSHDSEEAEDEDEEEEGEEGEGTEVIVSEKETALLMANAVT